MSESIQWGDSTGLVAYEAEYLKDRHLSPVAAGKDFTGSQLERKLHGLQPGTVLLDATQFHNVPVEEGMVQVDAYTIHELGLGREENRSGVLFGQLLLHSPSRGEQAELVALKPSTPRLAAKEHHVAARLQELTADAGRPLVFTTLGFFRDRVTGRTNRITRYEHGVQTADRVLWQEGARPGVAQVVDVLGKAAITLGFLHANGIAHGDPQPKNIAADNAGVRFIDLEDVSEFQDRHGEVDTFAARHKITIDLSLFLRRLNGDYGSLIGEHFAEPYVGRVAQSGVLPEYARATVDEVLDVARQPQEPIPRFRPSA